MPRRTWPSSSRKEFNQQTLTEKGRLISLRKGAAGHPPGQWRVSCEGFSEGRVSREESAFRKGEKKVRRRQCQLQVGEREVKRQGLNLAGGQVPAREYRYGQGWAERGAW